MLGTRTFTISLILGWAVLSHAAQPDYFPLHVGNQWVYRARGTRGDTALVLEITRTGVFNGRTYWLLQGFPERDYWLRMDDNGNLLAYDPGRDQEEIWYAFHAPEGEVYRTSLPGNCCGRAVVSSRKTKYRGPIGEVDNALEIGYPGVFQVGIERELFLPYIGMVHRTQNTGGPSFAAYDLVYSRTGGVTVIAAQEFGFGLTLDHSVYTADLMPPIDPSRAVPLLTARLTLRNTSVPISLTFPSGQTYDLVIRNEQGEVVYRWSEGKFFILAIRTETIGPGEKNWVILVRLGDDGKPWPQGKYTAEAWLTTAGPKTFAASVGFEIRHVF